MDKGKTGHDTLERIVNALFAYIPPEDKQSALDKLNEIIRGEEVNETVFLEQDIGAFQR